MCLVQHAGDTVHARHVPATLGGCHLVHWLQLPFLHCTFLPTKASGKVNRLHAVAGLCKFGRIDGLSHLCPGQMSLLFLWSFAALCFAFRLASFSIALQSLSPIMHDWQGNTDPITVFTSGAGGASFNLAGSFRTRCGLCTS